MTNALDKQVAGDHYKNLAIQPVEFIHANSIGYFEGNVIKYVSRWRQKNGIADLEKAKHYIELLIELESREGADAKVSADDDGWIKWGGGDRPVSSGTRVEVRLEDGGGFTELAGCIGWGHDGEPGDIMAYRVVKESRNG